MLKDVLRKFKTINGLLSLIFGQIFTAMCVYSSVCIRNKRFSDIENSDMWGNVTYPRIAANSFLGSFSEVNYIFFYLVGITLYFVIFSKNVYDVNPVKCKQTKDIRNIFCFRFIYGFFLAFITLSINMILTLLFIPNLPPEKLSWEYISARSDFMMNMYQNHALIYILIYNLEISIFVGIVADYTILFNYLKRRAEIIFRILAAIFLVLYCVITYDRYEWNIYFILDPANRYERGDKCCMLLVVMIIIDFVLLILNEHKLKNKSAKILKLGSNEK